MTLSYRKIGGIHWVRIGRVCISVCLVRRRVPAKMPSVYSTWPFVREMY